MSLYLTTPPAIEPVTLAEAKTWLRVDCDDENDLINGLIYAARKFCETGSRQAFITQSWKQTWDYFPWWDCPLTLSKGPILSVTTFAYTKQDGTSGTLTGAEYLLDKGLGRLTPIYAGSWPIAQPRIEAVQVTYSCGFGPAASDVPQNYKTAIKLMLAHLWQNRSAVEVGTIATKIPLGVEALLGSGHRGAYGG